MQTPKWDGQHSDVHNPGDRMWFCEHTRLLRDRTIFRSFSKHGKEPAFDFTEDDASQWPRRKLLPPGDQLPFPPTGAANLPRQ